MFNKEDIREVYSGCQSRATALFAVSNQQIPSNINYKTSKYSNSLNKYRLNVKKAENVLTKNFECVKYQIDITYSKYDNIFIYTGTYCINNKVLIELYEETIAQFPLYCYYIGEFDKDLFNNIINILEDCIEEVKEKKSKLWLLDKDLSLKDIELNYHSKYPISELFNDDFINVDKRINKWIADSNNNGIVILHGSPGTGKSSYIKSLIDKYRQSSFIYVTKEVFNTLVSTSIYDLVRAFTGSIIIFEDCESLVQSRDKFGNNLLSTILNMSDGILSSCKVCKFIVTFNSPLKDIDPALLRKGRCFIKYEFKKLERDKCVKLLEKLNKVGDIPIDGATLGEIFNYDEENYQVKHKKIGF